MQYHMTAKNLTAGYNGNPVFRNFEIKIPSGKITTLIGANGSGKSTVLKTLARLLTPLEGVVYLDGESIHRMPTKSVAQKLAMLPQGAQTPAGITVQDLAEYGRYPYRARLSGLTAKDDEIVRWALKSTNTVSYTHLDVYKRQPLPSQLPPISSKRSC